ncbi:hypothetical protein [Christiangramia sediminis]|uniref:Uncharacterized protein n=1 Tax=Christiangramia sediminis TaxID=2881336 RepID=A0A9X1RYL7_9FLAO|nr:hypothetical protein [Christiangramia sediminis]MCB7482466.1 hypothetical protein [Christiangramia sediminis]
MATQYIPTPVIHTYKEINAGKYASVKHYELDEVFNGKSLLSEKINIQKDRKYARSMPDYWLKIRNGNKWSKPLTGFFPTDYEGIYFGDVYYKKHLVLAEFLSNGKEVKIYYYQNYYTRQFQNLAPVTVI